MADFTETTPTSPRCRGGCNSFRYIAPLTLDPYFIMPMDSCTNFWVFDLTTSGIELQSPTPMPNTVNIKPITEKNRILDFEDHHLPTLMFFQTIKNRDIRTRALQIFDKYYMKLIP